MGRFDFENQEINIPDNGTVSFNPEAFDSAIRGNGVQLIHYAATRCPVGLIDQNDVTQRPHPDHEGCSNGFIYTEMGTITTLFTSNSLDKRDMQIGLGDSSSVRITLPRTYDPECCPDNIPLPVLVAPFDRFYLKEDAGLEVVHWQLFTANASGVDRLSFPVNDVLLLIDSQGKRYTKNNDFIINQYGYIQWILNKAPKVDPKTNMGSVYSIRYTYRPYFYVSNLSHEVRVAQTVDESGNRMVTRMPQAALLQREYTFLNQGSEKVENSANVRMQYVPKTGSFGPR